MKTVFMYEDGEAFSSWGEYLGSCNVPNFNDENSMEDAGFSMSDIEEDERGRYLDVNAKDFRFGYINEN
jgi:hypothetical protein